MSESETSKSQSEGIDISIIRSTQAGLPLCAEPYKKVAEEIGIDDRQLIERIKQMITSGMIRRIALIPNHYALGYLANGMAVWDVPDEHVDKAGEIIGKLDFVSHCYRRPRHLPEWPYNLFAMVHGKERTSTDEKIAMISDLLGEYNRGSAVLYSKRILKKTGLRI